MVEHRDEDYGVGVGGCYVGGGCEGLEVEGGGGGGLRDRGACLLVTRDVRGRAPDRTTIRRPMAIWERPRERAKYSWTTGWWGG